LPFETGDVLKSSCLVVNEPNHNLVFATELDGGEQCNLWGVTVGGSLEERFQ
jgi:hypothetical protein